jgi:hypothetical protein
MLTDSVRIVVYAIIENDPGNVCVCVVIKLLVYERMRRQIETRGRSLHRSIIVHLVVVYQTSKVADGAKSSIFGKSRRLSTASDGRRLRPCGLSGIGA